MSIPFRCPACGKTLSAANGMAGRKARCTDCDAPLVVPLPKGVAPTPGVEKQDVLVELKPEDASVFKHSEPLVAATRVPRKRPISSDAMMFAPKPPAHEEDLIDMTAMVDIVFFLLIFFLVTSFQAVQAVLNLPKPETLASDQSKASATQVQSDPNALQIKIEEDDSVLVDDEQVFGEEALWLSLKQIRDERSPDMSVVIIGSPDASHGAAVKVLDACASAKLINVRFLVEESAEAE